MWSYPKVQGLLLKPHTVFQKSGAEPLYTYHLWPPSQNPTSKTRLQVCSGAYVFLLSIKVRKWKKHKQHRHPHSKDKSVLYLSLFNGISKKALCGFAHQLKDNLWLKVKTPNAPLTKPLSTSLCTAEALTRSAGK